ncbi:MarR family winged helix-turn-helix transcriptional regulator [Kitasatospora sp. NPDC056531]|uniref:MarR family winged helix-turn-helix transcriptional regulator n=1 Tax=Kitasatospora sp. NPDC056531 TaxID=3345856 RepID=UPI0036954515
MSWAALRAARPASRITTQRALAADGYVIVTYTVRGFWGSGGEAATQQGLARRLGVAPSLVVALADQLQELGALERIRDPQDRRRQVLNLTPEGRTLLSRCAHAARTLDDELTADLSDTRRSALEQGLRLLCGQHLPH